MRSTARSVQRRAWHLGPSVALALGAAAGLASTSGLALAQDCKLSVHASPSVLYTGQSAAVNVLAHLPSNIYAFASAQFDVHATLPMWSFASSGVIAGPSVQGMSVSQPHAPHRGVYANPANPYRVWRGVFTPLTNAPALVEIAADPSAISVYPSRLTSSSVPGVVAGGSDWVFVNPLRVGRWVAAPGRGTRAGVVDDVIVDGRIITGENPASAILIGLLLPAVQKVGESKVRVEFDGRPESFAATVNTRGEGRPGEQLALNYTRIDFQPAGDDGIYGIIADLGGPEGSPVRFEAFLGGVRVAAGDLNANRATLWVDRVPDGIAASVKPSRARLELQSTLVSSYSVSGHGPSPTRVFLPNGRVVMADTIEFKATRHTSANNLRQIGLAAHNFEATGVRSLTLMPAQPR